MACTAVIYCKKIAVPPFDTQEMLISESKRGAKIHLGVSFVSMTFALYSVKVFSLCIATSEKDRVRHKTLGHLSIDIRS